MRIPSRSLVRALEKVVAGTKGRSPGGAGLDERFVARMVQESSSAGCKTNPKRLWALGGFGAGCFAAYGYNEYLKAESREVLSAIHSAIPDFVASLGENSRLHAHRSGSTGVIYQVKDEARVLAVKVLSDKDTADSEVASLRKFQGASGVIQLRSFGHDYSRAKSRHFVVMDFADADLWQVASNGLPAESAEVGFLNILEGLNEVHAQHMVHGDLSPDNVLRVQTQAGLRWVLGDLGQCRPVGHADLQQLPFSEGYAGPERQHSQADDVFALGKVLTFMIEGISRETPAEMPVGMKNLVRNLTQRDPRRRPSCKDIYEDPWVQGLLKEKNQQAGLKV